MLNLYFFILGTAIGSFLNVLIDRLPNGQSILGRSHCDYCKKTLRWFDLIPVVSFLLIKGKCRYCGKKLSWFYPGIELLTGVIFVTISFCICRDALQCVSTLVIYLGLASTLLVIFFADLKYQIIPDSMQILFLIFSILFRFQSVSIIHDPAAILYFLFTGVEVMLPILLLFLLTRGRGMGFGDVKLAFTIGVLLGLIGGLLALYIGFILGAIIGLILLLSKQKKLKSKIAFGPFLIIGTVIMLFWGDKIIGVVKRLYGI